MDSVSHENPWPIHTLRPFERIMPGISVPVGGARGHVNWGLPNLFDQHVVVLSSFTSLTGQLLMRGRLRRKRWLFWGERLHRNFGLRGLVQRRLAGPISHASGVVAIGRAAEDDYRQRFPNIPHFCIPYHCDLSGFFAIGDRPEAGQTTTFLFCGQMIVRKGVDLLLLAFDRLITLGFDARLLLVGREADLPKFLTMVKPATRLRIRYEGFQAPECLPNYFARADAFVLPSRFDGWGVVINQAMAAGLPIITSDAVGAGLDLVEDGVNGLRVPSDDLDMLYRAMEKFVISPILVRRWGQNSREKARDITPEAGADKWVRVFESVRADSATA
jgi:glycosyltransferase involved in cell wall biosynthesis